MIDSVMYIILALVFFGVMFVFVAGYQDGASFWEDFYAKEISHLINKAEPGTEIDLDVTKISNIAAGNGKDVTKIITINNVENIVTVSLRNSKGTSFKFFNDVDIVDWKIEYHTRGAEMNSLIFKVKESGKKNG